MAMSDNDPGVVPHSTPDQERAAEKRRAAAEAANSATRAVEPTEATPARKRTAKAE